MSERVLCERVVCVCERLCVTKPCVCVTKLYVREMCVTKLCETKLRVKEVSGWPVPYVPVPHLPCRWNMDVAKGHACHAKCRGVTDQRRYQTQPSTISATPATQNQRGCHQVPRLPHKWNVDVAKCHACHAKCRGIVVCERLCVTKLCVCDKDCVRQRVVCERLCVTKLCLKDCA